MVLITKGNNKKEIGEDDWIRKVEIRRGWEEQNENIRRKKS